MIGIDIILFLLASGVLLLVLELAAHRRRLEKIPIRIHVNGTRGKSSITRLIAAGLRESGMNVCAKTTGTLPYFIMPDGTEYPVFRPSNANVVEQVRIVSLAARCGAQALVIECMAVHPVLQWLCESKLVKATHGVISNVRPDHLDVMGPGESDVAAALAATTPMDGVLFVGDRKYLQVFMDAAADRKTRLVEVATRDEEAISPEEISGFSYIEHRSNVAMALEVCSQLGVDRATAIGGMWRVTPDAGAMTIHAIRFFGRRLYFANAFAANDPETTEYLWDLAVARCPEAEKRILVVNCRADRPDRSAQLGTASVRWHVDHFILIGDGIYFFARKAVSAGLPDRKLIHAGGKSDTELFEIVLDLSGKSALVMGIGNIKGQGLSLAQYFRNRSILKESA